MRQFLTYGHILTPEELESSPEEGVPETPPTLTQFKQQVGDTNNDLKIYLHTILVVVDVAIYFVYLYTKIYIFVSFLPIQLFRENLPTQNHRTSSGSRGSQPPDSLKWKNPAKRKSLLEGNRLSQCRTY